MMVIQGHLTQTEPFVSSASCLVGAALRVLVAIAGKARSAGRSSGSGAAGSRRAAGARRAAAVPSVISNGGLRNIRLDGVGRVDPKVGTVEELHVVVVETWDLVGQAGRAATRASDLDLSAAVRHGQLPFSLAQY